MAEVPRGLPPQDVRVDRRLFLERVAALAAAAATGTALSPGTLTASAAPPAPTIRLPDPGAVQSTEPYHMSLAELATLIRNRSLSPSELLEIYLGRIDAWDATLMAFNTIVAEAARRRADALGRSPWSGPLHGIPLALKDNYYTAGVRTTANSHIFVDFVPAFDATAWTRLQDAGAILIGKTQMGPLATSRATTPDGVHTTVNAWAPYDPRVSPGGSSSGSATSVALGLATASTGTQTGGSITDPAGRQGLTGLKPTMGRVSLHGIIPLTYTRDHPGPLARDARDAAIMLQAMAGPDPADPRTAGHPPVPDYLAAAEPARRGDAVTLRWPTRVGVLPGYLDVPKEPARGTLPGRAEAEAGARRAMLGKLEEAGATLVELPFPEDWDVLTSREFNDVRLPERTEPFLRYLRDDVRLFGVSLSPWIHGLLLSGPEYLRGQRARLLLLRRVLDAIFTRCDVVVQTAPIPFDMIGLPLITFPIGFERSSGTDLPMPALLGGPPWGEERLLSVAAAYQALTDWHRRRPPDPKTSRGDAGEDGELSKATPRRRMDVLDVLEEAQ
jgi:aspartyl-tRNA(Asn)/glutamyl-tRNA(Gln) amidotransferase subunit A